MAPLTIPRHLGRDIAASGGEEREAGLADLQRPVALAGDPGPRARSVPSATATPAALACRLAADAGS